MTAEKPIVVKEIKVTVQTITDDGNKSELVFKLEPGSFQMVQNREVVPVFEDAWSPPAKFETKPPGTTLSIFGVVADTLRYKWPGDANDQSNLMRVYAEQTVQANTEIQIHCDKHGEVMAFVNENNNILCPQCENGAFAKVSQTCRRGEK